MVCFANHGCASPLLPLRGARRIKVHFVHQTLLACPPQLYQLIPALDNAYKLTAMGILDILTDELRADEGFVSYGYQNSLGRLTIGYGRQIDKALSGGISQQEATYLLRNDIRRCLAEYERVMGHLDIDMPRQTALVNMLFNLGLTRFRSFKKMLAAIDRTDGCPDWNLAAQEALNSLWARQTGARAQRIAAQLKSGFSQQKRVQ